jgi:nucleoid-associated protein YgaU
MGLFDFVGNAGKNLFGGKEIDENAVREHLRSLGLKLSSLTVIADQAKKQVSLLGVAETLEDKEKAIVAAGNIKGVEKVDDRLRVQAAEAAPAEPEPAPARIEDAPEPAPEDAPTARFHTVVSGDTLSGIAKTYYGNAGKYMAIFEANRPMLEDPNRIYPGQVLRIPPQD